MSILQEYEKIKQNIGTEKYNQIQIFLENHKHYTLGDVYYCKSVWDEMEKWVKETQ